MALTKAKIETFLAEYEAKKLDLETKIQVSTEKINSEAQKRNGIFKQLEILNKKFEVINED